jgi:hypothetical protein
MPVSVVDPQEAVLRTCYNAIDPPSRDASGKRGAGPASFPLYHAGVTRSRCNGCHSVVEERRLNILFENLSSEFVLAIPSFTGRFGSHCFPEKFGYKFVTVCRYNE